MTAALLRALGDGVGNAPRLFGVASELQALRLACLGLSPVPRRPNGDLFEQGSQWDGAMLDAAHACEVLALYLQGLEHSRPPVATKRPHPADWAAYHESLRDGGAEVAEDLEDVADAMGRAARNWAARLRAAATHARASDRDAAPPERPTALCADSEIGSYDNQVTMIPPPSLGIRGPVGIDLCLASEIAGLWARGIRTVASCCGHGDRSLAVITVDPKYVSSMQGLGYDEPLIPYGFRPLTGCGRQEVP